MEICGNFNGILIRLQTQFLLPFIFLIITDVILTGEINLIFLKAHHNAECMCYFQIFANAIRISCIKFKFDSCYFLFEDCSGYQRKEQEFLNVFLLRQ